ncbi:MAG: hypothetical protein FJ276_32905, partial [Planctomycetes bacterium]|nr:hypothetical protein [Planctomycetota bacterium]
HFWGGEEITEVFVIRSQEEHPRVQMKITRGWTIRGVVRDAETDAPVAGAKVRPQVFAAPMVVPDRRRWATTDHLGKFELLGVMPGSHEVHIEHPRYADKDVRFPNEPEGAETEVTLDVRLRRVPGGRVSGQVTDREGVPLPGVVVSDADRASAESDAQGRFVLEYVQGATPVTQFALTARKKGFFEDGGHFLGAAADDVTLTLWPLPKWTGQVLSPEGLPVKQFRVQLAPLDDSRVEQVIVRDFAEAEGRFTLDFEQAGPHWLAIQAEGYAAWEKTIKVGKEPQSLDVRLERGVTVTGQVSGPLRRPREAQVVLVPEKERGESSRGAVFHSTAEVVAKAMQGVAERKTTAEDDGKFRIEHVRSGTYRLEISGPGITADRFWIRVSGDDVDVGRLKMQGTGRIVGQVTEPGDDPNPSPWPFVRGEIYGETDSGGPGRIEFITDEDGRFAVEDAPVGRVTVGISYMATADMGGYHLREAHVVEGRETQVLFTPPPGTPDVPLEFVVGDGSEAHRLAGLGLRESRPANEDDSSSWEEPHLAIGLLPLADVPAGIPPTVRCRLERPGVTPCTIRVVAKGHRRLHVAAWFVVYSETKPNEPVFRRELEVADATTQAPPIRIRLNPASLIGAIAPADTKTNVYVVSQTQRQPLLFENVFSDSWAFRFLPDGKYTVLARDPERGWARADSLAVAAGKITDAGTLRLSPGGAIECRTTTPLGHTVPGDLIATDSHGIEIRESTSYTIPNLWPGPWTVRLFDRSGNHVLASGKATIVATETVSCDLAVP